MNTLDINLAQNDSEGFKNTLIYRRKDKYVKTDLEYYIEFERAVLKIVGNVNDIESDDKEITKSLRLIRKWIKIYTEDWHVLFSNKDLEYLIQQDYIKKSENYDYILRSFKERKGNVVQEYYQTFGSFKGFWNKYFNSGYYDYEVSIKNNLINSEQSKEFILDLFNSSYNNKFDFINNLSNEHFTELLKDSEIYKILTKFLLNDFVEEKIVNNKDWLGNEKLLILYHKNNLFIEDLFENYELLTMKLNFHFFLITNYLDEDIINKELNNINWLQKISKEDIEKAIVNTDFRTNILTLYLLKTHRGDLIDVIIEVLNNLEQIEDDRLDEYDVQINSDKLNNCNYLYTLGVTCLLSADSFNLKIWPDNLTSIFQEDIGNLKIKTESAYGVRDFTASGFVINHFLEKLEHSISKDDFKRDGTNVVESNMYSVKDKVFILNGMIPILPTENNKEQSFLNIIYFLTSISNKLSTLETIMLSKKDLQNIWKKHLKIIKNCLPEHLDLLKNCKNIDIKSPRSLMKAIKMDGLSVNNFEEFLDDLEFWFEAELMNELIPKEKTNEKIRLKKF